MADLAESLAPVTDVHAHVLLPAVERLVAGHPGLAAWRERDVRRMGRASAEIGRRMVRERLDALVEIEPRISAMDAAGVDAQLVSVTPTQYHPWADENLARELWTAVHQELAAYCAVRPERLSGIGVVPLQWPDQAIQALDHAVECGLRGVEISTHADDPGGGPPIELSDHRLEPFWRRAAELEAVVFVHPWGCTLEERLDRWYLSNLVGQPAELTVALSHVILSGVLDRHPGLRLLAAHGGGYLPTYLGRSDHGWLTRPDVRGCARRPSEYLSELYVDSLVYRPADLRALVAATGAEHVLLGSDYPFDMGVPDPVARLAEADLKPPQAAAIAGGNARRLRLTPQREGEAR